MIAAACVSTAATGILGSEWCQCNQLNKALQHIANIELVSVTCIVLTIYVSFKYYSHFHSDVFRSDAIYLASN